VRQLFIFSRRLYTAVNQAPPLKQDRPYVTILKSVPATRITRTYPEYLRPAVSKELAGRISGKFRVSSFEF